MRRSCRSHEREQKPIKFLVAKPKVKRPVGRTTCRWEDDIKMCFIEAGWGIVDWTEFAQDWDERMVRYWNVGLHKMLEISWIAKQALASEEGPCPIILVI
jgi:hypothetical protein